MEHTIWWHNNPKHLYEPHMPSAPLKYCSTLGCRTLVARGRCPEHQREQRQHETRFQIGGNLYGRKWRRESQKFLADHPFCSCGCGRLSTEVDHRIPHRGDRELFWNRNNWQAMAKDCHSRKTAAEVGFARRQTRVGG